MDFNFSEVKMQAVSNGNGTKGYSGHVGSKTDSGKNDDSQFKDKSITTTSNWFPPVDGGVDTNLNDDGKYDEKYDVTFNPELSSHMRPKQEFRNSEAQEAQEAQEAPCTINTGGGRKKSVLINKRDRFGLTLVNKKKEYSEFSKELDVQIYLYKNKQYPVWDTFFSFQLPLNHEESTWASSQFIDMHEQSLAFRRFSIEDEYNNYYGEVNDYIASITRIDDHNLSFRIARDLIWELCNLLKVLSIMQLSHRDLHIGNMKIRYCNGHYIDTNIPVVSCLVAFDWGHSLYGASFDPLFDLNYIFKITALDTRLIYEIYRANTADLDTRLKKNPIATILTLISKDREQALSYFYLLRQLLIDKGVIKNLGDSIKLYHEHTNEENQLKMERNYETLYNTTLQWMNNNIPIKFSCSTSYRSTNNTNNV